MEVYHIQTIKITVTYNNAIKKTQLQYTIGQCKKQANKVKLLSFVVNL